MNQLIKKLSNFGVCHILEKYKMVEIFNDI